MRAAPTKVITYHDGWVCVFDDMILEYHDASTINPGLYKRRLRLDEPPENQISWAAGLHCDADAQDAILLAAEVEAWDTVCGIAAHAEWYGSRRLDT